MKKLLVCGIGVEEYDRILACESAKEIWDCSLGHKESEGIKDGHVDHPILEFHNKGGEIIYDMYTKMSSINNEVQSLDEPVSTRKQVKSASNPS